ncbi:MAG: phosphatidylglycerophosphatase A [Bryobacteraceae bacterium]
MKKKSQSPPKKTEAAPAAQPAASPRAGMFSTLWATWFGCGYSPVAPGTVGSLAALAIAYAAHVWLGWSGWHFFALALLMVTSAVKAAGRVAESLGSEDPQIVVVDEVVGQWMALGGAMTLNWKTWLLAFCLFRAFDIWKPFPARQLENLPGGTGIVADDMAAGAYAALVLLLLGWLNLY